MLPLQVITVFLVAVAMAMALAHALEYPGKMRLSRENYIATQSIYYPGFTIGGFGEALGVLATLALMLLMPRGSAPFWWSFVGFLALALMHAEGWKHLVRSGVPSAAILLPAGFFFSILTSRIISRRTHD